MEDADVESVDNAHVVKYSMLGWEYEVFGRKSFGRELVQSGA